MSYVITPGMFPDNSMFSCLSPGSGPPPLMENKVLAVQGGNATLPCRLHRQYGMAFGNAGMRVKWTKLSDDEAVEEDVLVFSETECRGLQAAAAGGSSNQHPPRCCCTCLWHNTSTEQ